MFLLTSFVSIWQWSKPAPSGASKRKVHTTEKSKGTRTPDRNEAEDSVYKKLMSFTSEEKGMLKDVSF